MRRRLLATLGPASLNQRVISRLDELGVDLFRLNLSHTQIEDAERLIRLVQAATRVPLSLDTEGAQIRTGDFVDPNITLRENSYVRICRKRVAGDALNFNLAPGFIVDQLQVGDVLTLDAEALVQVIETAEDSVKLRVLHGGQVGRNKAVTLRRDIDLPALTEKDRAILAIGRELGIKHVALSFANRAEDVDEIRAISGDDVEVIAKIECLNGICNLDAIAERADALLIDRGDLSRQVPLERIPRAQKSIIARATNLGVPVYVATNLLESMVVAPQPTRAEVNDVFNTLLDGADGLVLAAETAIGRFPIECTSMVRRLMDEFESSLSEPRDFCAEISEAAIRSMPHKQGEAEPSRLVVGRRSIEQAWALAHGLYEPLTGFLGQKDLLSVLHGHRLSDGSAWPMPVLLQIDDVTRDEINPSDVVQLCDAAGHTHAELEITEIFELDRLAVARQWFGTASPDHPAVREILAGGPFAVAGRVTPPEGGSTAPSPLSLPPRQLRFAMERKGWSRIVGFHTNAVPLRAHESYQLRAIEETHADGLLISVTSCPATGADQEIALKAYELMLEFAIYPQGRTLLVTLPAAQNSCFKRHAAFQALCHRNMGCTHFVFGHHHGFAHSQMESDALHEYLGTLGPLGIELLHYGDVDPADLHVRPLLRDNLGSQIGSNIPSS